eukprot:TRINITY_DN77112_c0_g1_i1.p1 TRINITY_DN77112_c0_g1~~TRINITY_DN77112_c0_g1_i1.p1  ORF type:complete len:461 (+),score=43.74 TRINITY_DN77112_c0_g1_i1:107-1384(+)
MTNTPPSTPSGSGGTANNGGGGAPPAVKREERVEKPVGSTAGTGAGKVDALRLMTTRLKTLESLVNKTGAIVNDLQAKVLKMDNDTRRKTDILSKVVSLLLHEWNSLSAVGWPGDHEKQSIITQELIHSQERSQQTDKRVRQLEEELRHLSQQQRSVMDEMQIKLQLNTQNTVRETRAALVVATIVGILCGAACTRAQLQSHNAHNLNLHHQQTVNGVSMSIPHNNTTPSTTATPADLKRRNSTPPGLFPSLLNMFPSHKQPLAVPTVVSPTPSQGLTTQSTFPAGSVDDLAGMVVVLPQDTSTNTSLSLGQRQQPSPAYPSVSSTSSTSDPAYTLGQQPTSPTVPTPPVATTGASSSPSSPSSVLSSSEESSVGSAASNSSSGSGLVPQDAQHTAPATQPTGQQDRFGLALQPQHGLSPVTCEA